jgi:hypothetical protein
MLYNGQSFPIIDINSYKIIDYKPRSEVHRNGDWHRAINVFIFRKIDNKLETLIQERSQYVDIAQNLIDQSLASQVIKEDKDVKGAFFRGLKEELGINKAVSGHFHESGHRANDTCGNHVSEGNLVTDLFWNSGHLDAGQTGILTVGDGKVSYRNIRLEEHLQ